MFVALTVILPIFALIFAGYGSRKIGVLGKNASSELNRFVVYLALPALLFSLMSKVSWRELYQPGFVAAFGLGCGFVFALTLVLQVRNKRHLADASIDGLNAAYPNTGFIGFPQGLAALLNNDKKVFTLAGILKPIAETITPNTGEKSSGFLTSDKLTFFSACPMLRSACNPISIRIIAIANNTHTVIMLAIVTGVRLSGPRATNPSGNPINPVFG